MPDAISTLWLIPTLPLLAAGALALAPRGQRDLSKALSIGSMLIALLLSVRALVASVKLQGHDEGVVRETLNFLWLRMGAGELKLGFVLDPLTAAMLVMVTFVSLLIFIYSVGYMEKDERFKQFFCFLSLFAAAMLGLIISNSLLLLFMCWELVGVASYLLIGFWFQKPEAAAAAKKAFITTRIGDMGFLIGMVWLYSETGTLLFYDSGVGCLEQDAITAMVAKTVAGSLTVSACIALLIFCGAMGKSGQFPLHVWLPDAMEGPTPVSALIHAATMVAAGVFLVARMFPVFEAVAPGVDGRSLALNVVTWVGAFTAVFAALIAVGQNDIKRILAYSTVSQLGYMMLGIGVGGVAVGMFHLIAHAFFKALLFLGAGSVIHGCHDEQDIRKMGGLWRAMPWTFYTYLVGMLCLTGFPFLIGFMSKDEILLSALLGNTGSVVSLGPFILGLVGAVLTAFYMTRQMYYVFDGAYRGAADGSPPHESPNVMIWPLAALAGCLLIFSLPFVHAWHHFSGFVDGAHHETPFKYIALAGGVSIAAFVIGVFAAFQLYRGRKNEASDAADVLEDRLPGMFATLRDKFYVDEFYETYVIQAVRWLTAAADWMDRKVWGGLTMVVSQVAVMFAWMVRLFDDYVINLGFDFSCRRVNDGGRLTAKTQSGQIQSYLRVIGIALAVGILLLTWGCGVQ
jgi:NADH-quinone oxidoreductase subunit L